ncbi:unnamed protein product [Cuscuta campestris]|uniref:HMG box domain-containing protein n=1 Tax=Cuscuta campestris TaxID=132261 RepID=A0A484KG67_9ASTE|nr:unnamed protein product [Cuscuta campestris]
MKGLKATSIAQKKLESDCTKKCKGGKANKDATKKGKANKIPGAPKRPLSAYLVFMSDFRKSYKENFPDNKSVAAVSKAGGDKWKLMSDSEKAPYVEKASQLKVQYGSAMEEFKKNSNGASSELTMSSSESVHTSDMKEGSDQEASC